ncbi:MAG: hypothetical protein Kow0075_02330 [Salibacteraceae bacterium]
MPHLLHSRLLSFIALIVISTSCMTVDGSTSYRKKNKCCGVIKCDIHRKSQMKKRKQAVTAHKSLRKKEERIKRGY